MNSLIETLNQRGGNFLSFAWPMLWQSSLLIAGLFAVDFLFRRRLRASIRYALWLVVLVKLCVPPTVALPTSPAWWLHTTPPPAVPKALPHYTVTYDNAPLPEISQAPLPAIVPPKPTMMIAAWLLVISAAVSLALLGWLLARWWQVTRLVRRAATAEQFSELLGEALRLAGAPVSGPACSSSFLKRAGSETGVPGAWQTSVRLKLVEGRMSPAVCGLLRPVILLPRSLAERLSAGQLRAVLLHELIHLRRRDVWLNFAQALLQIVYWWHPLVWLANARIRRVREEAVDDAVMLALREEAEAYAPTLLEVAKLALNRPLVSLGLVGIMESRHALRQRIERLVDFRPPRHAGLTLVSLLGILAFTAVAVPMGEGPAPAEKSSAVATTPVEEQSLTVTVNPEIFIRNVKAQAGKYLLAPTNDYTAILLDALRSEGVDGNPPNGLAFNTKTGEITTQNTPDKLAVFRQVVEQLNRADGICELPLHNPAIRRKPVLIKAVIYEIRSADLDRITAGLDFYPGSHGDGSWWSVAPEKFNQLIGSIESSGLRPIQRPRIQTWSGMAAQFYVGDETNHFEFDCVPFVKDSYVDLALQGTAATGQPGKAVFTNQFNTRASAEDHGGIVIRLKDFDGHAGSNLVAVIGVETVTNSVQPHFQQRLQAIIRRADDTNSMAAGTATNLLFARTYKVDTRTFSAGLKLAGAELDAKTNSAAQLSAAVRQFFASLGVNWESPAGKAVFFNDRNGMLFVKSTKADLDTMDKALQVLNAIEPQIHIKTRFVEVPKGTVAGFGGLLNASNAAAEIFSGILNPADASKVYHSLKAQKNSEIWGEPEITTTSGRQCQMRATQVITVITNFAYQESIITNNAGAVVPQMGTFETGPVVDLIPHVLVDGGTINLTVTTSLTEFLGYANPPNVPNVVRNENRIQLPVILPIFNKRQVTANLNLWDGQTAVLGGMSKKNIVKDKTPVLGSVPLVGRMFRSQHTNETEILVFVTAEIVDPAGNRVHTDDELPFTQMGIPPQPSQPK